MKKEIKKKKNKKKNFCAKNSLCRVHLEIVTQFGIYKIGLISYSMHQCTMYVRRTPSFAADELETVKHTKQFNRNEN